MCLTVVLYYWNCLCNYSGHPNEFIEKTIWLALLFIQQHHRRNLKDKCPSVSYLLGKVSRNYGNVLDV